MMLEVAHYQVPTCPKACSVQVYMSPASFVLQSFAPTHLSSGIFCWQPWEKKQQCSTYIKQQSTLNQGGLQQCRSSRLVPATGLHWIHRHIGLVSCVFFYSFTIPQLSLKRAAFLCKVYKKRIILCTHNSTKCTFPHFFAPCAMLMTKLFLFTARAGEWPS